MTKRKRLAVARVSYEGNSFNPLPCGQADFARREWAVGEAARALYEGTRGELGAVTDFLAENPRWPGRLPRLPPG